MRAILLGCGGAWPIPRPGCVCPQCASARQRPKERRSRSGLWLQGREETALLDASPDIAHQLEREGLTPHLDRVVISHHHHDHLLGLDDLCHVRPPGCAPLSVHAGAHAQTRIREVFPNLLREGREKIRLHPWGIGTRLDLGGILLEGFETHHRPDTETIGALLHVDREEGPRRIAYATDMGSDVPSPRRRLEGVDLLVGDGTYLGDAGYGHPGTSRVLEIARVLRVGRVALTHVGHWRVDPATARRQVPPDVVICRDGDDLLALPAPA